MVMLKEVKGALSVASKLRTSSLQRSVQQVRSFADDASDEAAKQKEEQLMAALREQALEDKDRTILPYHATEEAAPTVGDVNVPYPREVSLVSGTSMWSAGQEVHIKKPARHQMQSGTYNTRHWEIRFNAPRTWKNPLMGWASTADPYHGQLLKFDTKEDAIAFAQKQDWKIDVEEPAPTGDFEGQKAYSHNFLSEKVENLIKREGKKSCRQFRHPTGRRSNWVTSLKYHGNGPVQQHG